MKLRLLGINMSLLWHVAKIIILSPFTSLSKNTSTDSSPTVLPPLHLTCPGPCERRWGLLIPWCPEGPVALVSLETIMSEEWGRGRGALFGICVVITSAAETPRTAPAVSRLCWGWKGFGGNCRSFSGACAVMRGPREYFWG